MDDDSVTGRWCCWRHREGSFWAHLFLLLAATVSVLAAGVAQQGNLGLFLAIAGTALLVFPPRIAIAWNLVWVAAAIFGFATLPLLPRDWFHGSEWQRLLQSEGVSLPWSLTPNPRETCFWLVVLGLTIGCGLFSLSHPIGSRAQLFLASLAAGVCGVYAALSIYVSKSLVALPFDPDPNEFGFFQNRNHTATFLVIGCLLALGIIVVSIRDHRWLPASIACVSMALCGSALIFFTISRGGIMALLAGIALWLWGLGSAHRSRTLLLSFSAVFVAVGILFLAPNSRVYHRLVTFSGDIQRRMEKPGHDDSITATNAQKRSTTPLDGRSLIYADTIKMVMERPFTGTGLGTFRYIFPFYRKQALWDAPIIHPESDWIMLAAEAGVPALALVLAGLGLSIRRVWRLRAHPYWPMRWGILCAAMAAIIHGCVDVPSHRAALGWWILMLIGMGFQTSAGGRADASRLSRLLFAAVGITACAAGVWLICAEWFGGPVAPPWAGFALEPDIIQLREGQPGRAIVAATRAIEMYPMSHRLYYQLAAALLKSNAKESEIERALRVERLLEPDLPRVPRSQGLLWVERNSRKAADLWLEAVRLQIRLGVATHGGNVEALALFDELLAEAAVVPSLQHYLLDASRFGAEFTLEWMERALPELVSAELPKLAANSELCSALGRLDQRRFLKVWQTRGDLKEIIAWVAAHPDWRNAAWPIVIRGLTDAGRFEEAVGDAVGRFDIDLHLPEPGSDPGVASDALPENVAGSFMAYWSKGNVITARRVLDEARQHDLPGQRDSWRLSAALAVRDRQWQSAWQYIERYIAESHLDAPR